MDRETAIRMAKEAGASFSDEGDSLMFSKVGFNNAEDLCEFAAVVAAAVKEEDARICEAERVEEDGRGTAVAYNLAGYHCAAAIRASIKEVKS